MKKRLSKIKSSIAEILTMLFTKDPKKLSALTANSAAMSYALLSYIRSPLRFGTIVVAVFVLLFFVWGGLAPLDSAAIATGTIVTGGNQRIVQHQDGGIIAEILIADGDTVTAGEPLIKLSKVRAEAEVAIAKVQLINALLTKQRILSEETGKTAIDIPSKGLFALVDLKDEEIKHSFNNQLHLLQQREKDFSARKERLLSEIAAIETQMKGVTERLDSIKVQEKIAAEQYKDVKEVFLKSRSVSENDVLTEKRKYHAAKDESTHWNTELARLAKLKSTTEVQYNGVITEYNLRISEEYKENYKILLDSEARYKQAVDVLARTTVRAPVSGIVNDLKFHTIGGVITPGTPILSIAPIEEQLVVDCFVPPVEVVHIRAGMKAKVQLLSYNQRLVPRIDGEVIYVSPDKVMLGNAGGPKVDANGHPQDVFAARIRLDRAQLLKLRYQVKLLPGMPVNVFIIRGGRTFLQYMLAPIITSFHKAFTEE